MSGLHVYRYFVGDFVVSIQNESPSFLSGNVTSLLLFSNCVFVINRVINSTNVPKMCCIVECKKKTNSTHGRVVKQERECESCKYITGYRHAPKQITDFECVLLII